MKKEIESRIGVSTDLDLRVTKGGKIAGRSHIYGNEEDRTIRRTVKSETADLQIKWVEGDLVHVHCQKCKGKRDWDSEWSRTMGIPLSEKYEKEGIEGEAIRLTCKGCNRTWSSDTYQDSQ